MSREMDDIDMYLEDIANIPLLGKREERELLIKIKENDKEPERKI